MTTGGAQRNIFVADDDVGLVRLIERYLRREGLHTASAGTGREAIEWLSAHSADLVLLDLKLKDLEGSEVISQLAARNRSVPFIIITGQGDERVAVEMMKRGALDYLVKDTNFLDLIPTVVSRALEHLDQAKRLQVAEEASMRSRALTKAVLNSVPALIAVLDGEGRIVDVNEPWSRLHETGIGPSFAHAAIGDDYLKVCENAGKAGTAGAIDVALKIAGVLGAGRTEPPVEYSSFSSEEERWYTTTVTALAGAANGAVVIHFDSTERKRLEAEVLQIAETERQRVAADLHDGICQELAGIGFVIAALYRELKQTRHRLAGKTKTIEEAINDAVLHTREVARGLNAVVADGHGLMHALETLADTTTQNHRLQCAFVCRKNISINNAVAANELYRIAQEAISNAVRHGCAKNIAVKLAQQKGEVCLAVEDNGTGLKQPNSDHRGMGLRVMHYRAGLIGGRLTALKRKSGGTVVRCCIPNARVVSHDPG